MVTPALIDINVLALKHLDKAYFYKSIGDYDSCTDSLQSVNAALPPEYHIKFSTQQYEDLVSHPLEIFCKHCGTSHNRDTIRVWNMLLPLSLQIGKLSTTVRAWTCPDCKRTNILSESKIKKKIIEEPYFIKVVPEPPRRKQNLDDRVSFTITYKLWFGRTVRELTRQISQLRWDNHQSESKNGVDELQETILTALENKY